MKVYRSTKESIEVSDEYRYKPLHKHWLNIFYIPSDQVWKATQYALNYFVALDCLYMSVNNKCKTSSLEIINYIADGLFTLDLVMFGVEKLILHVSGKREQHYKRPIWVLLGGILSVIPHEALQSADDRHYCLMRLNRVFRILCPAYVIIQSYKNLCTSLVLQLIEFLLACTFFGVLMFSIYCNIMCFTSNCQGTSCDTNAFFLDVISAMEGINNRPLEDAFYRQITNGIFIFFVVTMSHFVRALIVIHANWNNAHQHDYIYSYRSMNHSLERMVVPDYLAKGLRDAFRCYWDNCGAYLDTKHYLQVVPPVMKNEVLIDISWPAFKHSELFRAMDLPTLRHLAMRVRQQFFLPGEVIYVKNSLKTKMIYIVSGTIALLSEEDGESPIICLTAGTIIGECSLYICWQSTNFVQCKTFCELHILERNDYNRMHTKFPKQFTRLRHIIADRLNFAKSSNELVRRTNASQAGIPRNTDVYTIVWLKNSLHRLMAKDVESAYRHEFPNIYLLKEIKQTNLSNMLFCASHLELLVIEERIEKTMDANFARLKFPYILHPSSIILYAWEFIIAIFATFLSCAVPNMVFICETEQEWYTPMVYLGTLIFFFDIFVRVSTSIKTHAGPLVTISSIANMRFQQFGFWVDLIAFFPLEIFSPVVLVELTINTRAILHLNRTLKIWRIARLFNVWAKSFKSNMPLIIYLKYTWLLSYICYLIYVYLQSYNPEMNSSQVILAALCWIKKLHVFKEHINTNDGVRAVLLATAFLTLLSFSASVSYVHVVNRFDLLKVQQVSYDLFALLKKAKIKSQYNRVIHALQTNWDMNWCYNFRDDVVDVTSLSKYIRNETMEQLFGDDLRGMEFFQGFSPEFMLDIVSKTNSFIFPPKEVICYFGSINNTMHILHQGYCKVIDEDGHIVRTLSNLSPINLPEIILGVPNATTCRTITHCNVLKITRHDFMGLLEKYQADWKIVDNLIRNTADIKERCMKLTSVKNRYHLHAVKDENISTRKFNYNLKPDSLEESDFFIPFDKLYPFSFVRYFFMRHTFLADGRLLMALQIIRSILALFSVLIYYTPIVVTEYVYMLDIIDVICLVDVYIKLHVCYYNEDGILISHPLKTSSNYAKKGLLVDIISVIPLRYICSLEYNWTSAIINSNHLLQLHTYTSLIKVCRQDRIKPTSKAFGLMYIPLLLIIWNTLAYLFFSIECVLDHSGPESDLYIGFSCSDDSLLAVSLFDKPITLIRAHLIYLYVTTSVMAGINFPGYVVSGTRAQIIVSIYIVLGMYLTVTVLSSLQEIYCFRQGSLLENQSAMKQLKRFLNTTVKDTKLKRVVFKTCELKWWRMKGAGIIDVLKPFRWSLRTDILDEVYGRFLHNHSPFIARSDTFYRNILTDLKFDLILKHGYLQTINDITDTLYIILSGEADIIVADGTKLDTIHAGSFYGNLSEDTMSRMRVSIIATTHVEILHLHAHIFMQVLAYYPKLQKEYHDLRAKYIYYIPVSWYEKVVKEKLITSRGIFTTVYDPNSFFIKIWGFIQLIFSSYAGLILDIYQLGSCDYDNTIITLQYCCDLLYFIYFLLRDRISYEDEWGNIVQDIDKIRKKNRENKVNLTMTLISMIPADALAYSLVDDEMTKRRLYSILRLNRLLRANYIYEYMKAVQKKLDVNVFATRFLSICLCGFLLINIYAALLAYFSCTFSPNLTPPVPPCYEIHAYEVKMTVKHYLTYLHIVWASFLCNTQTAYYPQGTIHLVVFILTMVSGYYCFLIVAAEVFSIVNELTVKKTHFLSIYDNMKYFLLRQGVSTALRLRCLNYCQKEWVTSNGEHYPKMLHNLSPYLLDVILNTAFATYIAKHHIFAKCHTDFVRQIVQKARHRTYYASDYVQFKGTIDNSMYFIFDGTVFALVDEYLHNDDCVSVLVRGDSFGIRQGLLRTPHRYSYRCHTNTLVLSLHLDRWEYLMDHFPASKELIYRRLKGYKDL